MRRFVFKLEGVLELRRQAEYQRQRELAETHKQIMQIEQELNQAAVAEKSATVPLRGKIDPRTLATQVRFREVMRQKLASMRQQLDAARLKLAAAQAGLVEAAKQRKVLEKLLEKQQARWLAEQQKREAAEQDDLAQRMTHEQNNSAESFPSHGP